MALSNEVVVEAVVALLEVVVEAEQRRPLLLMVLAKARLCDRRLGLVVGEALLPGSHA
jgi:hypothetical protein